MLGGGLGLRGGQNISLCFPAQASHTVTVSPEGGRPPQAHGSPLSTGSGDSWVSLLHSGSVLWHSSGLMANKQCWKATGFLPGSFQDCRVSRPTFGQLPSLSVNRISPFLERAELVKKCSLACPESSKMSTMTMWLQGTLFFHYAVTLNPRVIECIGQNNICTWKVYRNILNEVVKLEAIWLHRIEKLYEFMVRMTHIIENKPTSQSRC